MSEPEFLNNGNAAPGDPLYDEISRINNELINIRRQLAKKNIELERLNDELGESEQRFKALFQGIPVPVYTWQPSGDDFVLVDYNAAADAITGGVLSDFLGTTAAAMYPDRPDIVADLSRCFAERVSIRREMEYQFKTTGEPKTLVAKYAFVPPDLVLVHTEDITARKRAEMQLRELATSAEQQRLARELHDSVTQSLFLAASIAETLPHVWENNPDDMPQALSDLRRLTHGALAEMRTTLLELRPADLTKQRLGVLLRQLTDGMLARTKIDVVTTLEGNRPLPDEVKIALYRIAQEALNNIVKHSQADRAFVILRFEPDHVILNIRDEGRGFDPNATKPGSMGLDIMQERAQSIEATFVLESEPGRGTEITVTWVDN